MQTFVGKSSEFPRKIVHVIFDLRRGRSEWEDGLRTADCLAANDSRLKDLLQTSIQRHLVIDYAAYCSNLDY